MKNVMPRSPFTTRFSGPARETEARLRSLFRFKRKPPAALVALTLAAALFCGGLVSCQEAEKEPPPPEASLAQADPDKLSPPDLTLAPVDWDNLPELDPVYTPKLDGSVVIQNLRDAHAEWNRRSTGNFLYFAGDAAFCCPSLAGRTAEGSARWQEEEGSAVVVDMAVNDDRLVDGTVGGYSLHFVADWYKETVLESSFTSDLGDGTLELSEEEMLHAGWVLSELMRTAEWTVTADATVFDAAPDLNRNGVPEELRLLVPADYGSGQQLEVWEYGRRIYMEQGNESHAGWNALFLCTLDGEDYLLRYNPYANQGAAGYGYDLFTLEGGAEKGVRENELFFEINFGMPTPDGGMVDPEEIFAPEAINAFMEEINGLLSHSVQLLNTDQDLLRTFQREGRLEDTLGFLDKWKPVFSRDPNKTLLENLYDFRDAMAEDALRNQ